MSGGVAGPARGPRAAAYLVGGVAALAAVAADRLPLDRVPLAIGACLLVTAALCGRDDGPWGAALVVGAAGLGALAAGEGWGGVDVAAPTGAAVGGAVGLVLTPLADRVVAIGLGGTVSATVAVSAVIAVRDALPALGRPGAWGAWIVLLGAVNLLLWARDREVDLGGGRR
ncbi:MAG: hypothetical protein M0P31_12750 [Solirubrobacteraceae bacterium]|nr:hypothetical protein [Solirubrobacteraceae bacterium]